MPSALEALVQRNPQLQGNIDGFCHTVGLLVQADSPQDRQCIDEVFRRFSCYGKGTLGNPQEGLAQYIAMQLHLPDDRASLGWLHEYIVSYSGDY